MASPARCEWRRHFDREHSRHFYVNVESRETTWETPSLFVDAGDSLAGDAHVLLEPKPQLLAAGDQRRQGARCSTNTWEMLVILLLWMRGNGYLNSALDAMLRFIEFLRIFA